MKNKLDLLRNGWFSSSRDLRQMQAAFDKLFEDMSPRSQAASSEWVNAFNPSAEASEDQQAYYFKFDLPGIPKDQIRIELNDKALTVTAERKEERKSEGERPFFSEISYGSYFRSFSLPTAVDEKLIEAKYESGVLSLTIPKAEPTKVKQIEIH